jgi:hypothetical protein
MRPSQSPQLKADRLACSRPWSASGPSCPLAVIATALFLGQLPFPPVSLDAQSASTPASASAPAGKTPSANPNLAAQPAQQAQPAGVAPVAPPAPDWPANDRPAEATVTWDSHGLSIVAANSSLLQVLKDISLRTGATLEGLGKDQRIFGIYGPGPARDVISQLLDGSGYNVLMIGDQGQGTPRQIILSSQSGSSQPPGNVNSNTSSEEDTEADQQAQQVETPPQEQQPSPPQTSVTPAVPVRSQQQFIDELKQREQQLLQQQQQQQPQPQQNPQ